MIKSHHHRPHPLREEEKGLGNMPMRVGGETNEKQGREGKGDTQMKTVLSTKQCKQKIFTLFPDSSKMERGGGGKVQSHTMG